jgi:phage terminase large subunit-like protein
MLMLGLRLGADPRVVVTTTPRPTELIRTLIADPTVVVTRGTTDENSANLAPAFLGQVTYRAHCADRIVAEVNNGGDMVEATLRKIEPNAPFAAVRASRGKVTRAEPVAALYDPAVTKTEGSDETGIIVAGKDQGGRGWVLADAPGASSLSSGRKLRLQR